MMAVVGTALARAMLSFKENPREAAAPVSAINSTFAPSCGVPVESRTTPASFPGTSFACAAARCVPKDNTTAVRTRAPRIRSLSCFTFCYLPGAALATVLVSGAAFTVKSAVREIVCLESVSVALTSRVYFPGARVASGRRRSMVT